MISTNYQNSINNHWVPSLSFGKKSAVSFHSFETPVLHQWHQLISAMRRRTNRNQWITLINPPFIPNEHYLKEIGLGDFYVRVMHLKETSPSTIKYIQRCVQNGKSSLVAIWVGDSKELPEILLNDSPIGCQALVFCPDSPSAEHESSQIELAF